MRERETACPLELKLVASLRYLAVGAGWGAIEDAVNVSRVTLETWFNEKFIPWMMKNKFDQKVRYPKNAMELMQLKIPYEQAGFPNCIGCADDVHVFYKGYAVMDKWKYVGKEKRPSLSENCT